jgi:TP901 family phage tail tape measure protein
MPNVAELSVLLSLRDQASPGLKSFSSKLDNIGRQAGVAGRGLLMLAAPIVALGAGSLKAAVSFEAGFAGIRKTVDATEKEFAELSAGIRKMATEIPVSTNELNRIGEAAGQLGIETKNILKFTRVIADMAVTTNLTADAAATAFARIANITNLPQTKFENLGSTVVALGNNLATTEQEIVNFGLRIAGTATLVGLSEAQILALGGAMSSVGIQAERGGTAVQKVLIAIQSAIATSSSDLELFAEVAGQSAAEFGAAWEEDAGLAFTSFVEGLGAAGNDAFAILEELGLQDVRLIQSFLSLANAGDLLRTSIELGTDAWEENTALAIEAAKRYETTEAQFGIMMNQFKEMGIVIGIILLPAFKSFMDTLTPAIQQFADFAEENETLVKVAALAAFAVGGLGLALVAVGLILPALTASFGLLSASMAVAGVSAGVVGGLFAGMAVAAGLWVTRWGEIMMGFQNMWIHLLDFVLFILGAMETALEDFLNGVVEEVNKVIGLMGAVGLGGLVKPWDDVAIDITSSIHGMRDEALKTWEEMARFLEEPPHIDTPIKAQTDETGKMYEDLGARVEKAMRGWSDGVAGVDTQFRQSGGRIIATAAEMEEAMFALRDSFNLSDIVEGNMAAITNDMLNSSRMFDEMKDEFLDMGFEMDRALGLAAQALGGEMRTDLENILKTMDRGDTILEAWRKGWIDMEDVLAAVVSEFGSLENAVEGLLSAAVSEFDIFGKEMEGVFDDMTMKFLDMGFEMDKASTLAAHVLGEELRTNLENILQLMDEGDLLLEAWRNGWIEMEDVLTAVVFEFGSVEKAMEDVDSALENQKGSVDDLIDSYKRWKEGVGATGGSAALALIRGGTAPIMGGALPPMFAAGVGIAAMPQEVLQQLWMSTIADLDAVEHEGKRRWMFHGAVQSRGGFPRSMLQFLPEDLHALAVPLFARGGTVPGPVGAPQLAMVHGGERVIPVGAGGGGPTVVVNISGNTIIGELDLEETAVRGVTRAWRSGGLAFLGSS